MVQRHQYVVTDNKDILLKVRDLAIIARNNYLSEEKTNSSCGLVDISQVGLANYFEKRQQSELFCFLNSLDDEQIKVVQAVMYIGRDHEVPMPSDEELEEYYERKAEDPYYEMPRPSLRVENPDSYLSETIALLGKGKGWEDKFIEINIIMEKLMKLPTYISRGLEILGVQ